ncbi:MAG TPA: hypothetical protein VKV04_07775 [Verrucomicrobiae bacterium]|nr:hypothetical protein [Verrucomicrobiae bacterium]
MKQISPRRFAHRSFAGIRRNPELEMAIDVGCEHLAEIENSKGVKNGSGFGDSNEQ